MSEIFVNKNTYHGKNVQVVNGKIIIDNVDVTPTSKTVIISVEGNIENLIVEYSNTITIKGDVCNIKTASGDITIYGNITNGITTVSGDVNCENVTGNIKSVTGDIKIEEKNKKL